jgi:predicted dehydrogenase
MGYVGAGFLAQHVHLPNFATLPDSNFIALAEMRPHLAQAVAAKYAIPKVYHSHLDLAADPDIEAVAISAHFAQQGEIAIDLLQAGKHVFMEKPMAVSVAQAERILAASRQGKDRLMVAYMKRYDPGNMLAHDTVTRWQADGSLGEVLYVRNHGFCGDWISRLDTSSMISTDEPMSAVDVTGVLPSWLPSDKANAYLLYLQQYTHNVNLLRYLLNVEDDVHVQYVGLNDDGLTGIVVLSVGGIRCSIESGDIAYHDWDEHTQVYFKKGWIHLSAPPFFANPSQVRVEIYEGGASPSYHIPIVRPLTAWAYREEAAFFLKALRTDEPFKSSGEDTLTDVHLFEDIYRQYLHL